MVAFGYFDIHKHACLNICIVIFLGHGKTLVHSVLMRRLSVHFMPMCGKYDRPITALPSHRLLLNYFLKNIVATFRGMHVSPAKHSFAWLLIKCDYRTDRQMDRRRTKWSLCASMLRRRHKKLSSDFQLLPHPHINSSALLVPSSLLLQSACTSMCRHIYDWNIVVTFNNQFTSHLLVLSSIYFKTQSLTVHMISFFHKVTTLHIFTRLYFRNLSNLVL